MKKALLRSKTGTVCDIVLDEHKYYFRGDRVLGRLIIIPSKPHKTTGIRLEFFGRIKTYINSKKQDGHYFFKELFPLDVLPGTLQEGRTYTFPFDFNLPVEVSLPSCTESDTNAGGMIEYVVKATMEGPSREWSALTASVHIPVLERLDVSKTDLLEPVWDKVSWQSQHPEDIIDADEYQGVDQVDLSASIPHKGYTRDQKIPVTVDIQHFQPYQRTNGLTISLIRCTRILCKEKAYLLSPTVVSSTKVDIDIQQTTIQTITRSILIPRHISPTINLNARLMQVDYRIEVRAELDEPERNNNNNGSLASFMTMTADKRHTNVDLTLMSLELPVVIGTLPSPSSPPDVLDPKFVKGVKHIGQENQSKQQRQQQQQQERQPSRFSASFSALTSLDLTSIPAGLLEITSTSLRWDQSSSRRQSNMSRQQQQQQQQSLWSSPFSKDKTPSSPTIQTPITTINSSRSSSKIPTTSTTSSAPTMSTPTYTSGLAESTTMVSSPSSSIPVYSSELSETIATMASPSSTSATRSHLPPSSLSPFYLTLSLGEPFDFMQSGFTDNDQHSLQSTRISTSSKSSHGSLKGMEKDKLILTTELSPSTAHNHLAERLINGSSSSSSSPRSSVMGLNNNNNGSKPTATSTSGPSLLPTLNHSSDYLSSDASISLPSSQHSLLGDANGNGLVVSSEPMVNTSPIEPISASSPSPPLSSTTGYIDTPEHVSDIEPLSQYDTPKDDIDSSSMLIDDTITTQPSEPVSDVDDTMETTAHDGTTASSTTPMAAETISAGNELAGGDQRHRLDGLGEPNAGTRNDETTIVLKSMHTTTTTINDDKHGRCNIDDDDGGLDQLKELSGAGQIDNNNNNGLFPAITGVYRQVSTYSNYRATNPELLDKKQEAEEESTYKPESTIEGLEISAAIIEPAPMDPTTTSNDHHHHHHHRQEDEETAVTTTTTTGDGKPISNGIILHTQPVDSEADVFGKPHEMAYSDSDDDDDDDDDDFLSILARREKQAESSYWQ